MTAKSLDVRVPIWQAPIGSIAGPELAGAVARAGGMGALGLSWSTPEEARRSVGAVAAASDGAFQGNFVLAFEPLALPAALEAGLRVVSFSWGMPTEQVSLVRSFGAQLGIQVTNREGARRAVDIGADFLICQGVEAGGHVQATRSLWETLPEVLGEAGEIPVVAAGGLGGGAAIARALASGAAAAMLGTRFVATIEAAAHHWYKQRLVDATADQAVLTVCFDLGWPYAAHRVLRNSTLTGWEAAGCPPSGHRPGEHEVVARLAAGTPVLRYEDTPPRPGMAGDLEALCLYAGLGCDEITDIPTAKALVARLWSEAQAHGRDRNGATERARMGQ